MFDVRPKCSPRDRCRGGGEALLGRPSTSDSDRCGTRRCRSPPVASAAPGAPAHLPHQPHGAHSHGDRSSSAERAQREQDRKSKEEKEKARLSYLRTLYRPIRTGEKEPPYFRAGQRSAKGSTGTFSGPPRGCVAAARSRASIAAPNDACGCSRAVLGAHGGNGPASPDDDCGQIVIAPHEPHSYGNDCRAFFLLLFSVSVFGPALSGSGLQVRWAPRGRLDWVSRITKLREREYIHTQAQRSRRNRGKKIVTSGSSNVQLSRKVEKRVFVVNDTVFI